MELNRACRNVQLLEAMSTVVRYMNNEEVAERCWLTVFPDGASAEDLTEIAQDDELMNEVCFAFRRTVHRAGKDGWYTEPMLTPAIGLVYGAE